MRREQLISDAKRIATANTRNAIHAAVHVEAITA
jgi:hypothetical protein